MADILTPTPRPDGWTDADLAYRPEVMANAPAWCNHVAVYFELDGSMGIEYSYRHGAVEVAIAATSDSGNLTPMDGGARFLFFAGGDGIKVTPDELREYAADLLVAADALELQS